MAVYERFERSAQAQEALQMELDMLQAMYPEQVQWQAHRRELSYASQDGQASFILRIPDEYLISARPEPLTATIHKQDARNELKACVDECDLQIEVLDLIVERFGCMVERHATRSTVEGHRASPQADTSSPDSSLTIVVWLHHLLNTNKRKQALSPPLPGVAGVTKPGYPGVLVYSGQAQAVSEHVRELKHLNWQAFQVRLEVDEEWRFPHEGVVEVESMAEIVSAVGIHKQTFLQAMNIT